MLSTVNCKYNPGSIIIAHRRVCDNNSKVLLAHALNNFNWSPLYNMNTCQEMIDFFYDVVNRLLDLYMPYRSYKRHTNDKPWITDKFRRLIKCRQFAYAAGNTAQYNKYRNAVQRLAKSLRKSYYERNVKEMRASNPRSWWNNVKRFIGTSGGDSNELNGLADDVCNGHLDRLVEEINSFFASVASDLQPLNNNYLDNLIDDYCTDFIIEPFEVLFKLSKIDVNKSPGPDSMPNWLLKEMAPLIADPVCAIFNASIRQGSVPVMWKQANVVPVPKAHPPKSLQNDLRPISLTSTLAKVLESFIGSWILNKIQPNLAENQFGVLKGKSTSHALVAVLHTWCCALDAGESVRALFVDFSKAFDRVDHTLLLNKLVAYGVPCTLIKWLFSFLKDREQRVKIGQIYSTWCTLAAGFPQGTWLGPLAFITIIDDLQPPCTVHKFVDDTTFTEIIASKTPPAGWMNSVANWSNGLPRTT